MKNVRNLIGNVKSVDPETTANMVDTELYYLITKEIHGSPFSFNMMKLFPGGIVKEQSHSDQHAIFVISGKCQILLGDTWLEFVAGGFAYIPPRMSHSFKNIDHDATEVLILKL